MKTEELVWKSITIHSDTIFETALRTINTGGLQLCLVVSKEGKLEGMVTDSDVRKALLKGISLDQTVKVIMNRSPIVVNEVINDNDVYQLMIINHIFHLPIVDNSGKLIGLHVAEQLQREIDRNEALVIMAGGRGKRLIPLTDNCPKPMLPIKGKPILQHLIERARNNGFREVFISVNYLSKVIIDHFGDGSKFDISIKYLHEKEPLGTAGALAMLPETIKKRNIIVTNGDVITDVAYSDIIEQSTKESADGLMSVKIHEWQSPYGVINSIGSQIESLAEKPKYQFQINAGIYVIGPRLIRLVRNNVYLDMTDLFKEGLSKGLNLRIFPLHESWIDIGRHSDYKSVNQ